MVEGLASESTGAPPPPPPVLTPTASFPSPAFLENENFSSSTNCSSTLTKREHAHTQRSALRRTAAQVSYSLFSLFLLR